MKKFHHAPRSPLSHQHTEQSLLVGSGSLETSEEVAPGVTPGDGGVTNEFTNKYWDSDTEWAADN